MIEKIDQTLELNDGHRMPGYGFGCYKIKGEELKMALTTAWEAGYRLFDTAAFYDNEETVAKGLNIRPITEYFLISKIWLNGYGNPVKALDDSLRKLGRDYLNGYLLHWPGTDEKAMLSTYEKLLREKEKGKIRSLGVSNFLERHIDAIHSAFDQYPAINQIEAHPYFPQKDLVEYCQKRNIAVMAWAPLGRGVELKDTRVEKIAKETGKTAGQVLLRWQVQGNKIPIPRSAHSDRIILNAQVFDFSLSDAQMSVLDAMNKAGGRTGPDPATFNG